MDANSAMSQQWKQRGGKIFLQKAEVYAKETKNNTGMPKIDPLSRKVADLVTRREMEILGLLTAPVPKKKSITQGNSPDKVVPGHFEKNSYPKQLPKFESTSSISKKFPSYTGSDMLSGLDSVEDKRIKAELQQKISESSNPTLEPKVT